MDVKEKFNIKVFGQGRQTMMFIHGYGCDQSMWRFLTPEFEKDYQIVLLDLMGMGGSKYDKFDFVKYKDLYGYRDDVLDVCSQLQLKDVIFVGHSVAALIGALASIAQPKYFSKLILVGPSPCYFNDKEYQGGFEKSDLLAMLDQADKDYLGWARSMGPAVMGQPDRPHLGSELTNAFCKVQPEVAKHFARVVFLSDHRTEVNGVKTPTLILQCAQDIVAPEFVGEFLHQQIKSSTYVRLNATGHCPHISEPEETSMEIKKYLQR